MTWPLYLREAFAALGVGTLVCALSAVIVCCLFGAGHWLCRRGEGKD